MTGESGASGPRPASHEMTCVRTATQQPRGHLVEVVEPGRPIGPSGGEERAAGDPGHDVDPIQHIVIVERPETAKVECRGSAAST